MFASATMQTKDEAQAVVLVRLQYTGSSTNDNGLLQPETVKVYIVTIDLITEGTTVHCNGETHRTRLSFSDPNDNAELEERALLAAILFPQQGA